MSLIREITITAQAGISPSGKDDDDLKLVVDGTIRRNPLSRHKKSFFCGFTLEGKEHSYTEDSSLETGTHYIELFADKTPTLRSVKFTLAPSGFEGPKTNIRIYRPGPKDGIRQWQSWEQAVRDYNGGGDPDYLKKVYGIYKDGTDLKGKKLWPLILLFPLALVLFPLLIVNALATPRKAQLGKAGGQTTLSQRDERGGTLAVTTQPFIGSTIHKAERLDSENRLAFIRHPLYPAVGLSVIDNSDNIKYFLEGSELRETTPDGEIKGPGEYVKWPAVGDFDGDKRKEILVQYIVSGTGLFHPFYVYEEEGRSFRLLLKRNDGVSEAQLTDLNNDGKKEVIYSYVIDASGVGPRTWTVWKEIWGWQAGELEWVSHKFTSIYKNLILFYDYLLTDPDPSSWLKSYYPMISCLKAAAQKNISGAPADELRAVL